MTLPFYDIVFATEDRQRMVRHAEVFGYSHLFVLYPSSQWDMPLRLTEEHITAFNDKIETIEQQHKELQETTKVTLVPCFELSVGFDTLFSKHRQKGLHPFFMHSAHFCRMDPSLSMQNHIGKTASKGIIGFEDQVRFDFIHHRHSGLNHVVAKQLAEQGIFYVFDLHSFYTQSTQQTASDSKQNLMQARTLGRMHQNMRLCQKYQVPFVIGSFATTWKEMPLFRDMISLFEKNQLSQKEYRRQLDRFLGKRVISP